MNALLIMCLLRACACTGEHITYVIFNSGRLNYSDTLQAELIRQNVSSNDIMVYSPKPRALKSLPRRHGDSIQRVKWRSSLVLDHIDAMNLARKKYPHTKYICRLEDDIVLNQKAVANIRKWVHKCTPLCSFETTKKGIYLGNGTRAIVISISHLTRLLLYLKNHYWADPLDWLILYYSEQYGDIWTPKEPLQILKHANDHKSTLVDK